MWKQKGGSQCQTKIELRFMPCYSAITFQCSPYVCLLERAETHSEGHGTKAFLSELICVCKSHPLFPLLLCSQSEGQGGWPMPKGRAVCRSFIIGHTQWSTPGHRFAFFCSPVCFPSLNVKAMKSITDDKWV